MKALLQFTIQSRLRQLFGGKYAWAVNGWRLLWLLFAALYGCLMAFLMTVGYDKPDEINLSDLIFGLNVMAFMMVILRNIFPFYQAKPAFVPSIYPLSRWKGILLEVVHDSFSLLFFMALLFYGVLCFGKGYFFQHFLETMLLIGIGYFLERSLKKFLEEEFEGSKTALLLFGLLIFGFIAIHFWLPDAYDATRIGYSLALVGFFVSTLFFNTYLEGKRSQLKGGNQIVQTQSGKPMTLANAIIPYYFKNKKIRLMLIMGLGFKILFVGGTAFSYLKSGKLFFQPELMIWLFFSPLIIFTYTHCNLFGYMRAVWLGMVNSGNWLNLLKVYLLTMAIPLSIDALITFIGLGVMGWINLSSIAFYIGILLVGIFGGIVGSIYKPILFEQVKVFGKQQNASPWVTIPLMITLGGLAWAKSTIYFLPILLVSLLLPLGFLWKANQNWSLRWQKMFSTLFK